MKKNKMNNIVKLLLLNSIVFLATSNLKAQSIQQELINIYKVYDSTNYLTFDVKYKYTSDTLFGDYVNDVLEGTYTMAGKKAKYNLGDIDFMQNDSFFVAVYNEEKFILVNDPPNKNAGNILPLRAMMDSIVQVYAAHYTINQSIQNDTAIIKFIEADTLAQFKEFTIKYDSGNYVLYSINYFFEEPPILDPEVEYVMMPPARKRRLSISFSNYHFNNISEKIYDINNYIFWEPDGVYRPVEKYKDFQIYNSKTTVPSVIQ
jgi:hypothetical protein